MFFTQERNKTQTNIQEKKIQKWIKNSNWEKEEKKSKQKEEEAIREKVKERKREINEFSNQS